MPVSGPSISLPVFVAVFVALSSFVWVSAPSCDACCGDLAPALQVHRAVPKMGRFERCVLRWPRPPGKPSPFPEVPAFPVDSRVGREPSPKAPLARHRGEVWCRSRWLSRHPGKPEASAIDMPKVKFVREDVEIDVDEGANLRRAAIQHGVQLYPGIFRTFNCHGLGQCAECRVLIPRGMENTNKPNLIERVRGMLGFFRIGHEDDMRLACQTRVLGDIEVVTQPEFNWFGKSKK